MNFWAQLGTAVLGGLASSYEGRQQQQMSREQVEATGRENRRTAEFSAGLADWYMQRDRDEKRKAFGNYSQFSNLASLAPQYSQTYTAPALGTKPTAG